MANSRIRRTKSFSSYLAAVNQDVSTLKQQDNVSGIADGAIAGTNLAQEVSLTTSSMQSSNYAEGLTGWKIDGTGVAEFSDVFVRGDINAASGTIGYWNISSPGVERNIGSSRLFGTFLESSDLGDTDSNLTAENKGVYVGLFRSYRRAEVLLVSKSRRNNVAKIVAPNHGFELGDLVTVNVTDDTSFSSGSGYVELLYVDYDSFEYFNEGPDISASDGFQASGYANLYDENIAGLYLNDYSKSLFDHGYFSNQGVKYVSAQMYNYVHNPSFEYYQEGVRTESAAGWSVGSTLASATSGLITFTDDIPWALSKSTYGYKVAWGASELSDERLSGSLDYPLMAQVIKSNRSLFFNFDMFFDPMFDVTGPSSISEAEVLSGSSSLLTVTALEHGLSEGDFVYCVQLNPNRTLSGTTTTTSTTGTADTASTTVTLATTVDMTAFNVGARIQGLGIPANTTITNINIPERIVTISNSTSQVLTDNGLTITATLNPVYALPGIETGTNELRIGSIVKVNSVVDVDTFTVTNASLSGALPVGWKLTESPDYELALNTIQKVTLPVLKLSDIRLKFSNGEYRPLTDFVSSSTSAILSSALGKTPEQTYLTISPYEAEYYYSQNAGSLPPLGIVTGDTLNNKSSRTDVDIILDIATIYSTYRSVDPAGLEAGSNINIEFPGWMYKRSLGETPNSAKIVGDGGVYYIDNIFLSTENRFFYADGSVSDYNVSSYAWAEESLAPVSASFEKPKEWINIDLLNQGASLSYLDGVSLKSPLFSDNLLTKSGMYSTTTLLESEIVYPGYQGLGASRSTSLFITGGSFSKKSGTLEKIYESSLLSRGTTENSFIQISSNSQYIDPNDGYLVTYSAGLAVNSDETLSEATLYGDEVRITNRNYPWNLVVDEETGVESYIGGDRNLSAADQLVGNLYVDMNAYFDAGVTVSKYYDLGDMFYGDVIPYGLIEETYQRKLTLSGTAPIIVNRQGNSQEIVINGLADTSSITVADPYLITVGNAVSIPGEFTNYVSRINYDDLTVFLANSLSADQTDVTAIFYDENVVDISIDTTGLGGDTVAAGDGITIDTTTTPGTSIISSVVQEITSSDSTVTIDSTTTPGTYDLTVVPGGVTEITSDDATVTVTTTDGVVDLSVIAVLAIESTDSSISVTDDGAGNYDLTLTTPFSGISGTGPITVDDDGTGGFTVSITDGIAYNHTEDFNPIIYVGSAAPTAPVDGFRVGDVWVDY